MADEMLDQLLFMWREQSDALRGATLELRDAAAVIQAEIEDVAAPFKETMKDIEGRIKPLMLVHGKTYKGVPGVSANYRKGYKRISYDPKQADMVLAFLRDVLPNAAEQLEMARKESLVSPSVSVKAKEE